MTRSKADSTPVVKSADRVLLLLEYLGEKGTAGFAEVVRDLDLPSSSAHQLLHTAVVRGFVHFDEASRTYSLGVKVWELGQTFESGRDLDLAALCQPFMDRLSDETSETVQLAQLDGLENIYLAISESPHPMKLVSRVGARLPAHATGVGKVLMAGLTEDEFVRRSDGEVFEKFTKRTISDPDVLKAELRRIRSAGFGEDREEYVVGCRCVAMPIRNRSGDVIAALSVSIPTPRFDQHVAKRAKSRLAATVSEIEAHLVSQPRSART